MNGKDNKKGHLSLTAVAIISGIIVWPIWLGFVFGVIIFIEEVLGYKERYDGPAWLVDAVVFGIIGIGLFLWRLAGAAIASRWGIEEKTKNGS